MQNLKVMRAARRVSRLYMNHTNKSMPRTIQRGTVKYLPFVFQTTQTGNIDLKSFENATIELIMYDVTVISLNIALVMWNLKNMSKNDSSDGTL